jgi:spore germination protein GerM
MVAAVAIVGAWLRGLPTSSSASASGLVWPWSQATLTVYHAAGPHLFPVSRRVRATDDLPRIALQTLIDGPAPGSAPTRAVPAGVSLDSIHVVDGVAVVTLQGSLVDTPEDIDTATLAIVQTLTTISGIDAVTLRLGHHVVTTSTRRRPLLYFAAPDGLTAVTTMATTPHGAVEAYLTGPPSGPFTAPPLVGLPRDVRLLGYSFVDGLVSVNLSYSPSVRTLALERPDTMRTVILGLIASLTEQAGVRAALVDFEGRSQLGLGECSDLLRRPLPRPRLLNDERLVGRLR